MERNHRVWTVVILCGTLALAGCPEPQQAIVANGASNNLSAVDLASGDVTSDLGGIAIGPSVNRMKVRGTAAYVVNSGAFPGSTGGGIQVVDLATQTLADTIPLPDGDNPWDIAFASDTKAYVTALYGNYVAVLDLTQAGAAAIVGTIPMPVFGTVPAGPEGVIVVDGYAYVANTGFDGGGYASGSVSVIDTATDTLVDVDGDAGNGSDTPIFLSQINPQDLDVDPQGEINVVCTGDYASTFGVVDVIDPATWTVTASIPLGGSPGNITIGAQTALIGAGDATGCKLYAFDTATNAVLYDSASPLDLGATSGWCTVGKIATELQALVQTFWVPVGAWGAEAKLFELTLPGLTVSRTFDLTPGANLPVAVGIVVE